MSRVAPWLWMLAGALIGAGCLYTPWLWAIVSTLAGTPIAGASDGLPLILLGTILAVLLTWFGYGHGRWAALIGFGLTPAAILFFNKSTATLPCLYVPMTLPPHTCRYFTYPPSYDTYLYVAAAFLAIALIGALIPLVSRMARAARSGPHPRATNTL